MYYMVIGGYQLKCYSTLSRARAYKTEYGGDIYEVDIDRGLVRPIDNPFFQDLGITIGSMIDHLIRDHSENYTKGYSSIYALGASTEVIDVAHSSWHKGRNYGSKEENLPIPSHRHMTKGRIIYFENSEDKEIEGLEPIIDGYNDIEAVQ